MRKVIRNTHGKGRFRGSGSQRALAVVLLAALLWPSLLSAAGGPRPKPASEQPTVQKRVLKIPAGSIVVVRLRNKEKVKGRLGEVTNEGFVVQTAQGNGIEKRTLSFEEVKSIQTPSTTGHKVGLGLGIAGVGIGAVVLGILIWAITAS